MVMLWVALAAAAGGAAAAAGDDWEERLLAAVSTARVMETHAEFSTRTHFAGSEGDKALAARTAEILAESGFEVDVQEFEAPVPWPVRRRVELVEPTQFVCSLEETVVPEDPTSDDPTITPPFLAGVRSGMARGELVYANYARRVDFERLAELGVDVRGKVVIARYGELLRGIKGGLAQEYGAVGLLLFSDPIDDGFVVGEPFPEGVSRRSTSVQRGSMQLLQRCPGDPRACSGVDDPEESEVVIQIPSQCLSAEDAEPLLAALGGMAAPPEWQGALPLNYSIGPGPAVVEVELEVDYSVRPGWNVVGTLRGFEEPDRLVGLGNHRDAWIFGSADPSSGSAAILEIARAIGELVQDGWRPRRSIRIASFDHEEINIGGSTRYAVENTAELQQSMVAFVNIDTASGGTNLGLSASPSLAGFAGNCTDAVLDPLNGLPLRERWSGNVGVLGSGSDYAAFVHNVGIPAIDLGFGGATGGLYHSRDDSLYAMLTHVDPTGGFLTAASQLGALAVMRLAGSAELPHDYAAVANAIQEYTDTLEQLAGDNGVAIDVAPLRAAAGELAAAAASSQPSQDQLAFCEQAFLSSGLPDRPFYRHVLQAPGFFTGYDAVVLPGPYGLVEQGIGGVELAAQVDVAAERIVAAARCLE